MFENVRRWWNKRKRDEAAKKAQTLFFNSKGEKRRGWFLKNGCVVPYTALSALDRVILVGYQDENGKFHEHFHDYGKR